MSVKVKIAWILGTLFGGLLLLNALVLVPVVSPDFQDLEIAEVEEDMRRALDGLHLEIDNLDLLNAEWAASDDTYAYVGDRNPAFAATNLLPEVFVRARLDLLFILDREGWTVWGRVFDRTSRAFVTLGEFPEDGLGADHQLATHASEKSVVTGLVATARGPMLVSSRPITTSRLSGPVRGAIVMGRFLDAAAVARLGRRLHMDLRAYAIEDGVATGIDEPVPDPPPPGRISVAVNRDGQTVTAYATLADITGAPAILLHAHHSRDITVRGGTTVRYTLLFLILMAALFLAVVLYLLQRLVLRPLAQLSNHVASLTETGSLNEPLPVDRSDEVGSIARELEGLRNRIARLAHADGLTGLPNRILFLDRAEQVLKLARRQDRLAAIYFLDLDAFKVVNDTMGHAKGDRLLEAVAKRLQMRLRECDTISRFGGDEFTIIAHGMRLAHEAAVLGEKIVGLFADPFHVDGERLHITPSVGISIFPDHGNDVEVLLRNADIAMYRAKDLGRNTYQFFAPDLAAE